MTKRKLNREEVQMVLDEGGSSELILFAILLSTSKNPAVKAASLIALERARQITEGRWWTVFLLEAQKARKIRLVLGRCKDL